MIGLNCPQMLTDSPNLCEDKPSHQCCMASNPYSSIVGNPVSNFGDSFETANNILPGGFAGVALGVLSAYVAVKMFR